MSDLYQMPENHSKTDLIELSPDDRARVLSKIKSAVGALSHLNDEVKVSKCKVCTRHNTLYIVQHALRDMGEALGHEDDQKQNDESTLIHLRAANQEVHDLKQKLGQGITNHAAGLRLGQICSSIYDWWQELGFSYSKQSVSASKWGASIVCEFSVDVDRFVGSMDPTPVTSQAKLDKKKDYLAESLFLVPEERHSDRLVVLDCPENREWILTQLRTKYEKIRIHNIHSRCVHGTQDFCIWKIEANISLEDIKEPENGL